MQCFIVSEQFFAANFEEKITKLDGFYFLNISPDFAGGMFL